VSRPWRRRVALLLVAAAVVAAVLIGLRGTGRDSPEAAIYAIAHGIEHRDADTVCDRLFPSTSLPPGIAHRLDVAGAAVSPGASWETQREECGREFGNNGEFESLDFEDPRIRSIVDVRIEPSGGITRAARATVTLGTGRPQRVPLVEYRARWRVVFAVN
jgi:hypothetical protein